MRRGPLTLTLQEHEVSANFRELIDALKHTAERVMRRLFVERGPSGRPESVPDSGESSGGADDPYARVRVPRNRNPPGRAGAIALEEPRGDGRVDAVGRPR
jgi:hypothetical protein